MESDALSIVVVRRGTRRTTTFAMASVVVSDYWSREEDV
jgi:hypothetical protein